MSVVTDAKRIVYAARRARREVGRDEDLNAEVGTRNVEFFSVLKANGLNRPNWLNRLT